MSEDQISQQIIGTAIELHQQTGPGLLESVYEEALAYDLNEKGLTVKRQVPMPFIYKAIQLDVGYRIDLLVENQIVVEVKSVEALLPVHFSKTLTYCKLGGFKLGLLINFNSQLLKDEIHRIANNL